MPEKLQGHQIKAADWNWRSPDPETEEDNKYIPGAYIRYQLRNIVYRIFGYGVHVNDLPNREDKTGD